MRAWIPPRGRSDIASLLAVEPLDARPVASCFSTCYLIQRYICPRLRRAALLRAGRCYAGLSCEYKGKCCRPCVGIIRRTQRNRERHVTNDESHDVGGTRQRPAQISDNAYPR